jgi:hypothetical protein
LYEFCIGEKKLLDPRKKLSISSAAAAAAASEADSEVKLLDEEEWGAGAPGDAGGKIFDAVSYQDGLAEMVLDVPADVSCRALAALASMALAMVSMTTIRQLTLVHLSPGHEMRFCRGRASSATHTDWVLIQVVILGYLLIN